MVLEKVLLIDAKREGKSSQGKEMLESWTSLLGERRNRGSTFHEGERTGDMPRGFGPRRGCISRNERRGAEEALLMGEIEQVGGLRKGVAVERDRSLRKTQSNLFQHAGNKRLGKERPTISG